MNNNLRMKSLTCFQLQETSAVAFFFFLPRTTLFLGGVDQVDYLVITKLFGKPELKTSLWRAL